MMVANLIDPQKAVDAFESLFEQDSNETNWSKLYDYCVSLTDIWLLGMLYGDDWIQGARVRSKQVNKYEDMPTSWFWEHARVLTQQRMSPNELVEALRKAEDKEDRRPPSPLLLPGTVE